MVGAASGRVKRVALAGPTDRAFPHTLSSLRETGLADGWTEADAQAWWASHGPEPGGEEGGAREAGPPEPGDLLAETLPAG